ncbi:DUF2292 domain-containing protein [Priestia megaterium]|jgi:hypothetical protein|uniref:YezD family protein n=1 Tax=Priestia megaterium TaxID=1404 RepID=UPI000BFC4C2B|nr:YezD family protein [Priestia megaterium]PGR20087.1 DUF2292 domain-containing protein [Priestia megaterium]
MARVDEQKINYIIAALEKLQYGSLNITIHNGEITQVDCNEKHRFTLPDKQLSRHKGGASLVTSYR